MYSQSALSPEHNPTHKPYHFISQWELRSSFQVVGKQKVSSQVGLHFKSQNFEFTFQSQKHERED